MKKFLRAFLFTVLAASAGFAQTQKTTTPDWMLVPEPTANKGGFSILTNADSLECATPPTLQQVIDADFKSRIEVMSTARAASLKITWFGNASGSGAINEMVIVSQIARGAVCTAKDGKTRLLYGQTAFVTVLVCEWDGKGEVTFPVIAATATLKSRQYRVETEVRGFPSSTKVKFNEAKLAASTGITVENYAKFIEKEQAAESDAAASTTGAVQYIGVVMESGEQALARSAIEAYTLQAISEGRGCLDAAARYKQKTDQSSAIITDTYTAITKSCGGVDDASKAKARMLLNGLEVKQK